MTKQEFAPKDAETLRDEILIETGLEYEGNEEVVDKIVSLRLKDEGFKASLHEQKEKRGEKLTAYEKRMRDAGLDPETGEKIGSKNPNETPKNDGSLTPKDYLALTEHKIGSDDFDEVVRLSKLMEKSIAETLKDKTAQLIIKNRMEERATAEAMSVKTTRQKSGQSTEERLLSDLDKGILPDTEEGSAALAKAQFETLLKGTR